VFNILTTSFKLMVEESKKILYTYF